MGGGLSVLVRVTDCHTGGAEALVYWLGLLTVTPQGRRPWCIGSGYQLSNRRGGGLGVLVRVINCHTKGRRPRCIG